MALDLRPASSVLDHPSALVRSEMRPPAVGAEPRPAGEGDEILLGISSAEVRLGGAPGAVGSDRDGVMSAPSWPLAAQQSWYGMLWARLAGGLRSLRRTGAPEPANRHHQEQLAHRLFATGLHHLR